MPSRNRGRGGGWWDWTKGCGCVALVFLTLLALAGGWLITIQPLEEAIEVREILDGRYGPQEGFTPAVDGAVPADRMEAFLAVRELLLEPCAQLTDSLVAIERIERFGWNDEPLEKGLFRAIWRQGRDAMALETRRGEYFRARNQALLDAEMGLGEYTYVFVISYSAHLVAHEEVDGGVMFENVKVLARVRELLVEALQRQLDAVVDGSVAGEADAWRVELSAEIVRLEEDPDRIPWMDGLPAQIESSVEPYRERLDSLPCEAALNLELIRNQKQGISIHGH